MRALNLITIALFLILIHCSSALAAVDTSPHAMTMLELFQEDETVENRNNCSYCHPTLESVELRVWKEPPPSLRDFDDMTTRCYACHDGVAIVDANVDASKTAFAPNSHAFFQRRIKGGESELGVSLEFLQDKPLDCTSCHDIHNDTNRPFLIAPLEELCFKCHVGRRNSGYGINNVESNHPISMAPAESTGGASPIDIADQFKVPFPMKFPIAGGKYVDGVHWDLGGHLSIGDIGNVECYTCHSVHGDEDTGPNPKLLIVRPERKINDKFCESCHRGVRGDGNDKSNTYPNPGGTTGERTYHPVDDDDSNGPGRIVTIREPEGWPFGTTKEKNLLCSTCHDVHEGMPFSPILRIPVESETFCEECHFETPVGHHQTGKDSNPKDIKFSTTGYDWTYGEEIDWKNGNPTIVLAKNSISATNGYGKTYVNGSEVENKIYCSSCHRAHNAGTGIEKKAAPSLVVSHTANQLCYMCHIPENVIFSNDPQFMASHFIGDPTEESTYDTDDTYLYREEWKETKLFSKYGGDNESEIICESCHSFNSNNMNNPNYNYVNNKAMLLARMDPDAEWILGTGTIFEVKKEPDEDGIIPEIDLKVSEEPEEETGDYWEEKYKDEDDVEIIIEAKVSPEAVEANAFLCVGCHGENPGGGGSHPMMKLDGILPKGKLIDRTVVEPPATYTQFLNLNCFSCHAVHSGISVSGRFMLKVAESFTNTDPLAIRPQIDARKLCAKCHVGY